MEAGKSEREDKTSEAGSVAEIASLDESLNEPNVDDASVEMSVEASADETIEDEAIVDKSIVDDAIVGEATVDGAVGKTSVEETSVNGSIVDPPEDTSVDETSGITVESVADGVTKLNGTELF